MKSGDTNLLLYAMNSGCAEHVVAKAWLEAALAEPEAMITAAAVAVLDLPGLQATFLIQT